MTKVKAQLRANLKGLKNIKNGSNKINLYNYEHI